MIEISCVGGEVRRSSTGGMAVAIVGSLPCSYCVLWDVTKDIYHVHIAHREILINTNIQFILSVFFFTMCSTFYIMTKLNE